VRATFAAMTFTGCGSATARDDRREIGLPRRQRNDPQRTLDRSCRTSIQPRLGGRQRVTTGSPQSRHKRGRRRAIAEPTEPVQPRMMARDTEVTDRVARLHPITRSVDAAAWCVLTSPALAVWRCRTSQSSVGITKCTRCQDSLDTPSRQECDFIDGVSNQQ